MKYNQRACDKIRKIATGHNRLLLDYVYFKSYYKTIAVGLSKQQALDANPKVII